MRTCMQSLQLKKKSNIFGLGGTWYELTRLTSNVTYFNINSYSAISSSLIITLYMELWSALVFEFLVIFGVCYQYCQQFIYFEIHASHLQKSFVFSLADSLSAIKSFFVQMCGVDWVDLIWPIIRLLLPLRQRVYPVDLKKNRCFFFNLNVAEVTQ